MSDNSTQGGSDTIRDIDKGGVKTQVFALDVGGSGAEVLVDQGNPVPTSDDTVGSLLRRVLALLMSPRGYDKSQARQRVTASIENLPTLATVTNVGTVSNISQIAGRDASMLINPTNRTSWALNHRSRIT